MIYITGDTHGDISRFKSRELKRLTEKDCLIICGDFGFLWDGSPEEAANIDFLNRQKYRILFVDGTHENFNMLYKHSVVDLYSGKATQISRNIYHLRRGEIYDIEGKFIFTFGGGVSPDLQQMIDMGTWYEQELPTEDEMRYAVSNLKKFNCVVDYIITHEASATYKHKVWRNCDTNRVNLFLEQLATQIKYEKWFFGNVHSDFAVDENVFSVFSEIIPADGVRKNRRF